MGDNLWLSSAALIVVESEDEEMGNGKPGFGNQPAAIGPGGQRIPLRPSGDAAKKSSRTSSAYRRATEKQRKEDEELTKKFLAWADKADARLKFQNDVIVPFIFTRGATFLDEWLTQMISAKSDAAAPPEESKQNFFIALAGNLLWAASCFVPGAGIVKAASSVAVYGIGSSGNRQYAEVGGMTSLGKGLYAAMALTGAVAGAGGMAIDSAGAPSGKDVVATVLNDKRKKLGEYLRKSAQSWAGELVRQKGFSADDYAANAAGYLAAFETVLWQGIFPSIPFEGFTEIYQSALQAINLALADFNSQYKAWREVIERRAQYEVRTNHRYGVQAEYYQKLREKHERLYAFKPQLHFAVKGG